jgi:hypothetical protein
MKWEDCIIQRGNSAESFVRDFLHNPDRQILIIAGGGFDPRATEVSRLIAEGNQAKIRGIYLREERPSPSVKLSERAERNVALLKKYVPDSVFHHLDIFAMDGAPVGGRKAVEILNRVNLTGLTDIILDISALSPGVYFPLVRFFQDRAPGDSKFNLHLFVSDLPDLDHKITRISDDKASFVHGFKGTLALDESSRAAKLWLPQLTPGANAQLRTLHAFLQVDDVCPVLPFPCQNPRLPDELVWEHRELLTSWEVDFRNVVFAAQNDPRDLYFSILLIAEKRKMVFRDLGGSVVCLSPLGSKLLSVGALLAAMELNLPVAYVEVNSYDLADETEQASRGEVVHIWLAGEAYSS